VPLHRFISDVQQIHLEEWILVAYATNIVERRIEFKSVSHGVDSFPGVRGKEAPSVRDSP
jgi:hypothetical protein